jgi:hypothetical protein
VIAWDIGSRQDHSVGIVLDVTEEVFDIACYLRLQGDYPQIQRAIEDLHTAFARSSFTVIENNSMGAAVADNLTIPVHQLRRFTTSPASKERIIEALRLKFQLQLLRFQPSLTQLASELRDYQLPDTNCVQDSVMALAIALDHAAEAQNFEARGRINQRLFEELNEPPGGTPAAPRLSLSLGDPDPADSLAGPARKNPTACPAPAPSLWAIPTGLNEAHTDPAMSPPQEPAASLRIPAATRRPAPRRRRPGSQEAPASSSPTRVRGSRERRRERRSSCRRGGSTSRRP